MALDPDYIPLLSECKDCWGIGYVGDFCSSEHCDDPVCDWEGECPTCNGTGEVDLRE
jgi:hypothetical protein